MTMSICPNPAWKVKQLPKPADPRSTFLKPVLIAGGPINITSYGLGEIKPHNESGIKKGLEQLDEAPKGRFKPMLLVTYLPVDTNGRPQQEGFAKKVLIFAIEYLRNDRDVIKARVERYKNNPWYRVGEINLDDAKLAKIASDLGHRQRFGAVIEPWIHECFMNFMKTNFPKRKLVQNTGGPRKGLDLRWYELAKFYDELARELGDPFYADLASELASLSRGVARWDAA